jgi:hypothetical protein
MEHASECVLVVKRWLSLPRSRRPTLCWRLASMPTSSIPKRSTGSPPQSSENSARRLEFFAAGLAGRLGVLGSMGPLGEKDTAASETEFEIRESEDSAGLGVFPKASQEAVSGVNVGVNKCTISAGCPRQRQPGGQSS